MKLTFDKRFWDKSNFLARTCFVIGAFFMDLGMKLSGFDTKPND